MGKLLKLPNAPIEFRVELDEVLLQEEFELLQEVLQLYFYARVGGKNNVPETVRREILVCQRFFAYCGKAPWHLDESDFLRWCYHLGQEKNCTESTQRLYQSYIQTFYRYFSTKCRKKEFIEQRYRVRIEQIVDDNFRIAHRKEDESTRIRKAIPRPEIDLLFAKMREATKEAKESSSKNYLPLERDRVMFYLTYICGLRADEVISLKLGSFQPNPKRPEMRNHGIVIVRGKGSRGSGKKRGEVPILSTAAAELLERYEKKIRPLMTKNLKEENDKTYFLSERGKKMCYQTFLTRFNRALQIAGLTEHKYTPHCLRHSSVTHKGESLSVEGNRRFHRHEQASTTTGYTHFGDEYVAVEFDDCLNYEKEWREQHYSP